MELKIPSIPKRRSKTLTALLMLAALTFPFTTGCSKQNDIDVGPTTGGDSCNGEVCEGACIEGACHTFCDENYQCPGENVCTALDDVPVCLPPDARVYEPYRTFDMLAECSKHGCEVPLDPPPIQGVLKDCGGALTIDDMENPDFDYRAACADPPTYLARRVLQGRRVHAISEDGVCSWKHVGGGPTATLIEYSCSYDGIDQLVTHANFASVVEQAGVTYVWTTEASPLYGFTYGYARLAMLFEGEQLEIPTDCRFDAGPGGVRATDCELPSYPALGSAVGPEFQGFWVSCDTPNAVAPEDCDLGFEGPSPDGHPRKALYIDSRGYGQVLHIEGAVSEAEPTQCNAAFRVARRRIDDPNFGTLELSNGWVLGSDIPFGKVVLELDLFEEVVEVSDGDAPGAYLVNNQASDYRYKKLPLPDDFADPCEGVTPALTW